jgi:hypothetical protein
MRGKLEQVSRHRASGSLIWNDTGRTGGHARDHPVVHGPPQWRRGGLPTG